MLLASCPGLLCEGLLESLIEMLTGGIADETKVKIFNICQVGVSFRKSIGGEEEILEL